MEVWKDAFSAEYRRLLDDVRQRKVAQPTSANFQAEQWVAQSKTALCADTHRLIRLGSAVHATLSGIRSRLAALADDARVTQHRGHVVLLYANSLDQMVESKSLLTLKEGGPLVPDFVASEGVEGVSTNLRPTLVNLAESIYDPLRYPVCDFLSDSAKRPVRMPSAAVFEWAGEVHKLACLYASCEYVWSRAVWGEAEVILTSPSWDLRSPNPAIEALIAIAKHLSEVDKMLTPVELDEAWQQIPPEDRMLSVPPKAEISIRKGALKVHWDWASRSINTVPAEIVARQIIQNRLPLSVVDLVEPCAGSSVSEAMRVRELLSQVGHGIAKLMRSSHAETAVRVLGATLDAGQLVSAISAAARIPEKRAGLLVELFTFRDARSELWFQPLVQVQEGRLAFALHPLRFASPIRTMEWLLARDKEKEGSKGRAFEDGAYGYLQEAAALNKVVDVRVSRRLTTSGAIGDIDLLVVFGGIVLVIECKCPLLPTSENDFFNRENALRRASRQALRKAEFVCQEFAAFSARHKLGISKVDAILPVVMVSGNEYVGASLEGCVPIVSKASISLALANRTDTLRQYDNEGAAQSVRESEAASMDPVSVVRRLLDEISMPSMIELYRPFVVRDSASYEIEAQPLSLELFEVRFNEEKREEFLRALGVS